MQMTVNTGGGTVGAVASKKIGRIEMAFQRVQISKFRRTSPAGTPAFSSEHGGNILPERRPKNLFH